MDYVPQIIAEATQIAYRGATTDVQNKIRRVVEVWRARQVFELPIQEAVESRIDEVDRTRSANKKPLMGGSLFSNAPGTLPAELQPLAPLQLTLSKAALASTTTTNTANSDYDKLHDPAANIPSPPVHAARLSALLKSLANAESSVSESIKARDALVAGLTSILETNRAALTADRETLSQLQTRKTSTEVKKREVEDGIMRAYSAENIPVNATPGSGGGSGDPRRSSNEPPMDRPEVEALTPPPIEPPTPPMRPDSQELDPATASVPLIPEEDSDVNDLLATMTSHNAASFDANADLIDEAYKVAPSAADDHHQTAKAPQPQSRMPPARRSGSPGGMNGTAAIKRRKMSHGSEEMDEGMMVGFEEGGDAMADLDADVAELLRQESAKV
ncbi:MAG: hypothetical protein Q9227_003110 [Pyrenula ochraceoflavens]